MNFEKQMIAGGWGITYFDWPFGVIKKWWPINKIEGYGRCSNAGGTEE